MKSSEIIIICLLLLCISAIAVLIFFNNKMAMDVTSTIQKINLELESARAESNGLRNILNDYKLQLKTVSDKIDNLAITNNNEANLPFPKGMTWGVMPESDMQNDKTFVSCYGKPQVNGGSCDAYTGDTSCIKELPVLCVNTSDDSANAVSEENGEKTYGSIALTQAIKGSSLSSLEDANAVCKKAFGDAWEMAEFHNAGGWGFWGKGKIPMQQRFWVYINDQNANCWNSAKDQ